MMQIILEKFQNFIFEYIGEIYYTIITIKLNIIVIIILLIALISKNII